MKVPYGSVLSPYFQDIYVRLLQHEHETFKDKFLILQVERSLQHHIDDANKLHVELLEKYGERHPDRQGVYIFPKENDEGEWEVDSKATEEAGFLVYVPDEEKLDAVGREQQELSETTFEYEPLLNLDFFERAGFEMTTSELAAVWFLFEEGELLSPLGSEMEEVPTID